MGLLGKILPWGRKKDELALQQDLGLGGLGAYEANPYQQAPQQREAIDPWGQPSQPLGGAQPLQQYPMQQAPMDSFQSTRAYAAAKEVEVVSAKLDAVKAALESINQRLANIERAVQLMQMQQSQQAQPGQIRRGGW